MPTLNIVLVEPQIPQNTGNVARTCAATGARLHLVEPMGFRVDDAKLKRAGLDYWHLLDITYYESLEDFLKRTKTEISFIFPQRRKRFIPKLNTPINLILFSAKKLQGYLKNCFTIILKNV